MCILQNREECSTTKLFVSCPQEKTTWGFDLLWDRMQLPYFRFILGSFGDFGKHFKKWGKKRNYLTWFYFYFCTLKKCPSKFFYLFLHSPHGVYFSKWFYVPFPRPSYELDYYDVVVYVVSFKEFERHA